VTFGSRSARLVRLLEASGELPVETLPIRASGRPVRDAADADFPQYRDAVDAAPEDWKAWFRLGLAYDAAGDRKRARGAIRTAITLERAAA
ncbi:tetratricopeptide repeat protein, partial [Cryobacterium sp. 10I1]